MTPISSYVPLLCSPHHPKPAWVLFVKRKKTGSRVSELCEEQQEEMILTHFTVKRALYECQCLLIHSKKGHVEGGSLGA